MSTIISTDAVVDFQQILHFVNENNVSIKSIHEIDFEQSYMIVATDDIVKNFNVKVDNSTHHMVHWSDLDYLNTEELTQEGVTVQILDVTHRDGDEYKTVYYIKSFN